MARRMGLTEVMRTKAGIPSREEKKVEQESNNNVAAVEPSDVTEPSTDHSNMYDNVEVAPDLSISNEEINVRDVQMVEKKIEKNPFEPMPGDDIENNPVDMVPLESDAEIHKRNFRKIEGVTLPITEEKNEVVDKLKDEKALKAYEEKKKRKEKKNESKQKGSFLAGFFGKKTNSDNTVKKSKPDGIPYSVQKSIPYRNVYANGIIEIDEGVFSKSYLLDDVNFSIAPQEDQENMYTQYEKLLNAFGSDEQLSITIFNRTLNSEQFSHDTLFKYENDGLNDYRDEMNNMLIQKISEGKNNLIHEKYLTVSTKAPNIEEAVHAFSRIDINVSKNVKSLNKQETRPLTIDERLRILYDVYADKNSPVLDREREINGRVIKTFDLENLNRQGLSSKDIIGPASISFSRDYFQLGDKYGRALYLENYPAFVDTDILSDITDLATNMLVTVHFQSMRQDQAIKLVRSQNVNIGANVIDAQKKASRAGYSADMISPTIKKAQEEVTKLMEDLTERNQKLFFISIVITVFGDDKDELEKSTKMVESTASKHLFTIKALNYLQSKGLTASIPIGKNPLKVKRLATTESAAVFIPFSVQEWRQKRGFYYGVNAVSHNMITYNRKQGLNYNGVILGTPGSGKSFSSKREMINALIGTRDEVYVIDPEGEYTPLVKLLNGDVVKISVGGDVHLNPFDMDINYADKEDPVTLKSDFIGSLCDIIIGGQFGLSPSQKSVIDRCVRALYVPYLKAIKQRREAGENVTCDPSIAPTMEDFYKLLLRQPEQDARDIALSLEIYAIGSLNTFAKRTNVKTDARFVAYDIKDIGSGMKELGLQICLDSIWNKMIANKHQGKFTWIYIDEFHILAQNESSAKYCQQIYKRARKWGGIPTGMTQNVEDLLQSKEMRSVINTSAFVMMLNQAPMDKIELGKMFNMSEDELGYITNADPGQGLIYNGKALSPFIDQFPSDTKLYKAMTTKLDDSAVQSAKKEQDETF